MSTRRWLAAGLATVAFAATALVAPVGASGPEQAPKTVKVSVGDNFFKKKTVRIPAGTTIRWKNTGGVNHNIVPNEGDLFGINPMSPDKVYKFTFDEPGKYKYYCSLHGAPNIGQHGTIVVTAPPPPPTTPPPPTGPPTP